MNLFKQEDRALVITLTSLCIFLSFAGLTAILRLIMGINGFQGVYIVQAFTYSVVIVGVSLLVLLVGSMWYRDKTRNNEGR